jgi:hypothetical protein
MIEKAKQFVRFHEGKLLALLVLLLVAFSIVSRFLFNGQIFEFDYFLFQPDGAAYTYMALKYTGLSHLEAANEVISWYSVHAEPGSLLDLTFFSAESNPAVWGLVNSRVVYPLLSAPFVLFLGVPGMLVVPTISFVALLFMILRLGKMTNNYTLSLMLVTLLTISPTISRWYVANITDGLLATILAAACLLVILRTTNLVTPSLFLVLIIVGSFTRFSMPYWYAIGFFLLLTAKKRLAILTFFLSTLCFLPSFLQGRKIGAFVPVREGGTIEKILYLPISAARVAFIEFAQLAALDRILLILIVGAIVVALSTWRNSTSQLFLFFCLAGWLIGALNGTLGVNFRYQLPVLFPAVFVLLKELKIQMSHRKALDS